VNAPSVAVVIPTHNRPERLLRCLRALIAQTRPPDEIVVVDDGSAPATTLPPDLAQDRIRILRNDPPAGAAAARNRGWRATSSDYVLFTDDDCRPTPGWVAEMLQDAEPDAVLVGRTLPDPEDGALRTPFDRAVRMERSDGGFLTCNVLYPCAVLDRIGGFDERFSLLGEDTDMGQRALLAGAHDRYVDDALVFHAILPGSLRGRLPERRRIKDMARLAAAHPHLRRQLWCGYFISVDHSLLLTGLGAGPPVPSLLSGAMRRGESRRRRVLSLAAAAVALVPTARYVQRLGGRSADLDGGRPLANAAGWLALDLVEIWFLVQASVEHRTLLL
jgi:GT2 family glycosyltransferase